ncbi:MAG: transcriptional repressor LexA [Eggerthellaceae bacterium]|nr:transcriptional repressor LexA [Eggerthellaceae bacterium]
MAKNITKRQQAVLDCIEEYIAEKGYGPSVRDVCERMGLSSPSTVFVHLNALEEKGFIRKDPLKSRSITLVNPSNSQVSAFGSTDYNIIELPLVGDVAAGEPILAEENITNRISLPTEIVGDSATFLLSVHGDSMVEAGINDGDYLVVREQQTADNGDIVVALIEDGATVKRFYKEADHIRLQPENSSMEPIIVTDCAIVGKVVAQFRRIV